MLGHVLVDIVEHLRGAAQVAIGKRAVALGFLLRCRDLCLQFRLRGRVLVLGPCANRDQMLLEPRDRVPQRKVRPVVGRAVLDGSSEVECGPAR